MTENTVFQPETYFKIIDQDLFSSKYEEYKLGLKENTLDFNYTTIHSLNNIYSCNYYIMIIKIPVDIPVIKVGINKFISPCIYIESIHAYTDFWKNPTIVPDLKSILTGAVGPTGPLKKQDYHVYAVIFTTLCALYMIKNLL